MRIGYFTLNHKKKTAYLDLKWLNKQKVAAVTKYTKWIHLERPLSVTIDGETGDGSIIKPLTPIQEIMNFYKIEKNLGPK